MLIKHLPAKKFIASGTAIRLEFSNSREFHAVKRVGVIHGGYLHWNLRIFVLFFLAYSAAFSGRFFSVSQTKHSFRRYSACGFVWCKRRQYWVGTDRGRYENASKTLSATVPLHPLISLINSEGYVLPWSLIYLIIDLFEPRATSTMLVPWTWSRLEVTLHFRIP